MTAWVRVAHSDRFLNSKVTASGKGLSCSWAGAHLQNSPHRKGSWAKRKFYVHETRTVHRQGQNASATLSLTRPSRKVVGVDITTSDVDETLLSPMMHHYVTTKRELSASLCNSSDRSVLLMYRCGDFFESFFEDARLLSQICDLALTSKDAGKALGSRVSMAGIPHYAIDEKIKMLLSEDVTVAVVDQVQSSADTPSGKLVKRAITRLITPGTASDDALLDSKKSSYIACLVAKQATSQNSHNSAILDNQSALQHTQFGFAFADVSTGEFKVTDGLGLDAIHQLLASITPAEVLLATTRSQNDLYSRLVEEVRDGGVGVISKHDIPTLRAAEQSILEFCAVDDVESIGCRGRPLCVEAAAVLLSFTRETLAVNYGNERLPSLSPLTTFALNDVMLLDGACLRNMEVVESIRDGVREKSLQWAVDRTVTSMGARCLRSWLLAPSMDLQTIEDRQQTVAALLEDPEDRREIVQDHLKGIGDLERLAGRVASGRATPRELRWLCESILVLPSIVSIMKDCITQHREENGLLLKEAYANVPVLRQELVSLAEEVVAALMDPAPSTLVSELSISGNGFSRENWGLASTQIFRQGYNETIDHHRLAVDDPENWIRLLEDKEKSRTGIDNLRIKHIRNVGYVVRVPRSVGERRMDDDPMIFAKMGYERVQSTKAELRFRFEDLKVQERSHISAMSDVILLELRLYDELRSRFVEEVEYVRSLAKKIASIDVLAGFAQVAEEQCYVKPTMFDKSRRILDLEDARHPVVEQSLPVGQTFVPNSFQLGRGSERSQPDLMVLCGPNAAGKSCAMRSIGLISILAQIGCFVPAKSASLSLCDRVFTRVGAVDDLARGQSTFQVEMAETACILSHATPWSLVLLDEIGRGTSTVDGIAIAWSVAEYLAHGRRGDVEGKPPRSVFVTHFHELNQLASVHSNIESFHVHMQRKGIEAEGGGSSSQEGWISTHKVLPGPSYDSLGLIIAQRAGFPEAVMKRAEQIASFLREPARVLGAELRTALSCDKQDPRTVVTDNEDLTNKVCDGRGANGEEYMKGFEEGFARAKEEVAMEIELMLGRITTPH